MGDEQGQGSLVAASVFFLDENHCRNPHMIAAIEESGCICEKHLDHFKAGTEDIVWLPVIAQRGWSLVTADARIRTNLLERESVRTHGIRMFYFSRNDSSGSDMGLALRRAMPKMREILRTQAPPFTVSINKRGDEVTLRDTFSKEEK